MKKYLSQERLDPTPWICFNSSMDMKRWAELMKHAKDPPVKVTKEEKLKGFDLKGYFNWLTGATEFLLAFKGKLTKEHDDTPEKIHQRALKLGMIRRL